MKKIHVHDINAVKICQAKHFNLWNWRQMVMRQRLEAWHNFFAAGTLECVTINRQTEYIVVIVKSLEEAGCRGTCYWKMFLNLVLLDRQEFQRWFLVNYGVLLSRCNYKMLQGILGCVYVCLFVCTIITCCTHKMDWKERKEMVSKYV